MLDIVIDEIKDEFNGKVVKSIEISKFHITIYFEDGDFVRVEAVSDAPIMAWTAR